MGTKIENPSDDKVVKAEIKLNDAFTTENRNHIGIFNNMNGIEIPS